MQQATQTPTQSPLFHKDVQNVKCNRITSNYRGEISGNTTFQIGNIWWQISTCKNYRKVISTTAQRFQGADTNGNCTVVMYSPMQDRCINLHTSESNRATEKNIYDCHMKGIGIFFQMWDNGDIPKGENEYKIEIGQIIFSEGNWGKNERVIYEIINGTFGATYKTANIDGSGVSTDSHIRDIEQKFGIGTYYTKGDIYTGNLEKLVNQCIEAQIKADNQKAIEAKEQAEKEAQKKAYLSQFKQADNRTGTNLLKEYILEKYPSVSKVEVKKDSFSGGSSMDVTYYAPENIEELDVFIKSFQYGHFDGMNDIYEYNDNESIIIKGHIMPTYKYVSAYFSQSDAVRTQPTERTNLSECDGVKVTLNDEKNGVEVKFNGKPSEDILSELKGMGFRWSKFQKIWYAKQSEKTISFANSLTNQTEE